MVDVNRRFFVRCVSRIAAPGARVLDFGCGDGELVLALREAGFDARGCDVRWGGATYGWEGAPPGVFSYFDAGGRLPYEDASFDVLVSDQVFEHVEPLEASIKELERVLHREGVMVHQFPSRESWREPHIGILLTHRLPRGRLRLSYATLARRLGAGIYKDDRPAGEWAREKLDWIDRWTTYRTVAEIKAMLAPSFDVRNLEMDYLRFRAAGRPFIGRILSYPRLLPAAEWLSRRLGVVVIECSRR